MKVKVKFLGAAKSVTGSKYLVSSDKFNILIDCGQFQGKRELCKRNWDNLPINPKDIDAVVLTHAHIDHTGMLPRFHKLGLNCPVYCTPATLDLVSLLLPDSGRLQEDEAFYRAKKKKSRHSSPMPLFTEQDARNVLKLIKPKEFDKTFEILENVKITYKRMGHIIGAASLKLEIEDKIINFSGDIGRYSVPILVNPEPVEFGDLLLIESTYGNREHKDYDIKTKLAEVINKTYQDNGVLLIPSFAVGRAQLLLYYIRELKAENLIPNIPVILDSPMAADATQIYKSNPNDYDEESNKLFESGQSPFNFDKLALIKDSSASKKLNKIKDPMIIISASGMLYGGRILHHLVQRIEDENNAILFVGYQPPGSKGDKIKRGDEYIKIFQDKFKVNAKIYEISGLSAHADKNEMTKWIESCKGTPKKVAIVHGENDVMIGFKKTLEQKYGWNCVIPDYLEEITV